ncbi:MAG: sulfotransferase [Bacteroidetes bacterium]|nr:sulfotransferase [Bacteroidota bacterium]
MIETCGYNIEKLYDDNVVPKVNRYFHLTASHRMLPSFFIAGVQKGGTTSLCQYAGQHPQIIPPQRKDIYFFNNEIHHQKGINWYRAHFPHIAYKKIYEVMYGVKAVTFDGTPNYFDTPMAAQRLKKEFPDAKIILLLRNPVERAYSNYRMAVKFGFENLSFEEALMIEEERLLSQAKFAPALQAHNYVYQRLSYKKRGVYIDFIKPWKELFGKNLLILATENLLLFPQQNMNLVTDFLQLDRFNNYHFELFNKSENSNEMPVPVKKMLSNYYQPFNQQLFNYLKTDYAWN